MRGICPACKPSRLNNVYAGDTIYPALEVTELLPGRTTGLIALRSNVINQLVLEGMQKCLIAGGLVGPGEKSVSHATWLAVPHALGCAGRHREPDRHE